MDLLQSLLDISLTDRIVQVEKLEKKEAISGDFEGSVRGTWVKLGEDGTGVVAYNDKQYKTKPIGLTSLPAGTEVELSFAKGVYYSKY